MRKSSCQCYLIQSFLRIGSGKALALAVSADQESLINEFHFSREHFGYTHSSFVVAKQSPLKDALWDAISFLRDAGILGKISFGYTFDTQTLRIFVIRD